MRTVILRNVHHQLLTAFKPKLIWADDQPPDIIVWGSRNFVFSTMDAESVVFVEAACFSFIDSITAEILPQSELMALRAVDPVEMR